MDGQVTEFVAVSWIEKPWGRSSRSTSRRMPPGLPSRAEAAGAWAAAGAAARPEKIKTSARLRATVGMRGLLAESYRAPLPPPLSRGRGGGRGERSDGDGLVDRHPPLGEAPVGAAHHIHVGGEQPLGDGADAPVAELEAIHR